MLTRSSSGRSKRSRPGRVHAEADLKDVNSLFIVQMAEGDSVMLPMKGFENTAPSPVGTGPFKFVA